MLFLYILRCLFVFIYLFTILVYHIVLWILNDSFIHLIMRCNTFYIYTIYIGFDLLLFCWGVLHLHSSTILACNFLSLYLFFFFFGLFVFVSGFPHKMNMFHLFQFLLNFLHLFGRVSMWIHQGQFFLLEFLITNSVLLLVACPAYLFLSDSVLTVYMFLKLW